MSLPFARCSTSRIVPHVPCRGTPRIIAPAAVLPAMNHVPQTASRAYYFSGLLTSGLLPGSALPPKACP